MSAPAELRLVLSARPDNLGLVRQALAGLAEGAELGAVEIGDLKQVATELCMNSIVHGYPGDGTADGAIEIVAVATTESVDLTVRDWGTGIHPRPAQPGGSPRLGMPLVAALTASVEVSEPAGGGTVVHARIGRPAAQSAAGERERGAPSTVEVSAGPSAKPVIARVLAIAATRVGLSVDRMSDGVLLGDAIAAHDPGDFANSRVVVAIDEAAQGLRLRVGPFVDGGAKRLIERLEVPGLGASLVGIADRLEIEGGAEPESNYVVIEIAAT